MRKIKGGEEGEVGKIRVMDEVRDERGNDGGGIKKKGRGSEEK